jgi:hypothetical protein
VRRKNLIDDIAKKTYKKNRKPFLRIGGYHR